MLYWIWDLSILFMYMYKIKSLQENDKTNEPKTNQKVMFILNKITILTLFYQIIGFSSRIFVRIITQLFDFNQVVIIIIFQFIASTITLSWAYSMYLMMDHNQRKYLKFLSIIKHLKFHWICCCWRYKVIDQLNELNIKLGRNIKHSKHGSSRETTNDVTSSDKDEQIELETCNGSSDQNHSTVNTENNVENIVHWRGYHICDCNTCQW